MFISSTNRVGTRNLISVRPVYRSRGKPSWAGKNLPVCRPRRATKWTLSMMYNYTVIQTKFVPKILVPNSLMIQPRPSLWGTDRYWTRRGPSFFLPSRESTMQAAQMEISKVQSSSFGRKNTLIRRDPVSSVDSSWWYQGYSATH